MLDDTIAAPATPFGTGGLAVIRLSGKASHEITQKLESGINKTRFKPRYATLVNLVNMKGIELDEAVVTYFKEPNSYTGEDVVEISCHGGPIIVNEILEACCAHGARIAEPGEFTRRAFLNGKMDLIQAEAVAGLIHANSSEGAQINHNMLRGSLSVKLKSIKQKLIDLLSRIEFELDISETDAQPGLLEYISVNLNTISDNLSDLLSSYQQGRLLTSGASVVIAGLPNVGKSTLLNALTDSDRSITSPQSGTTRDSVDVPIILNGVPLRFIDTAGLSDSNDPIEQEGVRRSKELIKKADLIISVAEPDHIVNYPISSNGTPEIKLINKSDLINNFTENQAKHPDRLFVSAKFGRGISLLKSKIRDALHTSSSLSSNIYLTSSRQKLAIENTHVFIGSALNHLKSKVIPYELLSIDIHSGLEEIDCLLGKTTADDILDNIFGQFCVGK